MYKVIQEFKSRCCNFHFEKGNILTIKNSISKKFLLVYDEKTKTYHKITNGDIKNYCKEEKI